VQGREIAELLDQARDGLGSVGISPSERTTFRPSATATAIVAAWTSRPKYRVLFRTAGSFHM
jgi:hypothetical protein